MTTNGAMPTSASTLQATVTRPRALLSSSGRLARVSSSCVGGQQWHMVLTSAFQLQGRLRQDGARVVLCGGTDTLIQHAAGNGTPPVTVFADRG